MGRKQTLAVIGAGISGLLCMKTLKEEGLEFVCFESTGYYGGLWKYHEDDVEGVASVMKTTTINTSKELGAVSDFPPPAEFPNYMPQELMLQYFWMIAQRISAEDHIKFHHHVLSITPAEDYQQTGRWVVVARDNKNHVTSRTTFDGVMVCTGHHVFPNMPPFPGLSDFQGMIMHTHSLKRVTEFGDKRVVVIGMGNSGVDAAVEISNVAKQVYLSSRRGSWVVPKLAQYGNPADAAYHRRSGHFIRRCLPFNVVCSIAESGVNKRFNHFTYNLNPKHRILSQHPTINDTLPVKLLSGTVAIRGIVKEFTRTGVVFDGEKKLTQVDAAIFATGYKIEFPFLSDSILKAEKNWVKLFKNVYPPHLAHPTLAIIGLAQPNGPGIPVLEMQCRWSARVMSRKCSLPSQDKMLRDIQKKENILRKTFVDSPRHTIQVEFIDYLDELAVLIGAKPNFWKMAFTDPKLFKACITGPSLPYQYRLQGPHAWNGARDAILTYKSRVKAPFLRPGSQEANANRKYTTIRFSDIRLVFALLLLWYLHSAFTGTREI